MTACGRPADVGDSKSPLFLFPFPHSPTRTLLLKGSFEIHLCGDKRDWLDFVTRIALASYTQVDEYQISPIRILV
jgi:hypothetical protein